jgi:hypothetical protein
LATLIWQPIFISIPPERQKAPLFRAPFHFLHCNIFRRGQQLFHFGFEQAPQ